MSAAINPMKALRERLSKIGIKPSYLNNAVLPTWWDDAIALEPAGFMEGLVYISRHLGLTQKFLLGDSSQYFKRHGQTKLKKTIGVAPEDIQFSQAIAVSAARIAALGANGDFSLPRTPLNIRNEILKKSKTVNLSSLLAFCWNRGVPVIHVSNLPKIGKKMGGLCVTIDGRPVIVLSKNSKFPAWLVFILAHELGHIFHKHLGEESVLVDQKLSPKSEDVEEQEANDFASLVLTGHEGFKVQGTAPLNGVSLATSAKAFGRQHVIDPGVVALNYGWTEDNFACANKALNLIEPNSETKALINRSMLENIDTDEIPDESFEWLLRVTEADQYA